MLCNIFPRPLEEQIIFCMKLPRFAPVHLPSCAYILRFSSSAFRAYSKIGRKHKVHRQQLQQGKPWRDSEKGRGPDKTKGKGKGKGKGRNMGQDQSVPDVDEFTPPQSLSSRNLDGVAQYIKEGRARRIVVMVRILIFDVHAPYTLLTYIDRRRHKHIRWNTRFQIARHGTLCQPGATQSTIR